MAQKISDSEKERLDKLQQQVNEKVLAYGRQQYIVEQIKEQLNEEEQAADEMKEEIRELQNEYDDFVRQLYQKYGDVAVDLDSGDIVGRRDS